jgi:hypothetical protein
MHRHGNDPTGQVSGCPHGGDDGGAHHGFAPMRVSQYPLDQKQPHPLRKRVEKAHDNAGKLIFGQHIIRFVLDLLALGYLDFCMDHFRCLLICLSDQKRRGTRLPSTTFSTMIEMSMSSKTTV